MYLSPLVWETLARRGVDVVTTDALAGLARTAGLDARHAVDHLVRSRRLEPLFKGVYYVRRPEEVMLGVERRSPLELFALAAKAKGIGRWYFGLHTALRLHGMTHEHRGDVEVVCEGLHRPLGVEMAGTRFVIHKWKPDLFGWGVTRIRGLPVSDPARTVLDLAYRDYWAARKGRAPTGEWREHLDRVEAADLARWSRRMPEPVRAWMREQA